jgi:hypothetical protein
MITSAGGRPRSWTSEARKGDTSGFRRSARFGAYASKNHFIAGRVSHGPSANRR